MKRKHIYAMFIAVLFLLPSVGLAQDVSFTTSAKKNVVVGERFQIGFTLNEKGRDFKAPDFSGFKVIMGPSVSTQQGYQMVNGRTTRTYSNTYTFTLQAVEEGSFIIKPASVKVDGERYFTDALTIKVGKASKRVKRGNSTNEQGQDLSEYAFLKAIPDKTSAYVGEQIIVAYKLYVKVQVVDNDYGALPKYNGFWTKRLESDSNPVASVEVIDGQQYNVYTIAKDAIFAQRAGKLKTTPLEFNIVGRVRVARQNRSNDPFDVFSNSMFGSYKNISMNLESKELTFNIKDFPISNKPSGFNGLVGNYRVSSSLTPKELNVNDALTYKISVSGQGNLKLLTTPKLNLPPDFEVYEPKLVDNVKADYTKGLSGTMTWEWVIIPKSAGEYSIPAWTLSYFDARKGKYISQNTPSYEVKVNRGNGQGFDQLSSQGNVQENIKVLGSDIRYIQDRSSFKKAGDRLFASSIFFIILGGAFLILVILVLVVNKQKEKLGNVSEMRIKKANKVAVNRMKNAKTLLDSNKESEYFEEVSQALWGYLGDKFSIPLSELSLENVKDKLKSKQVDEELIDLFHDVLEQCDFARFAPGDKAAIMQQLYSKSLEAIVRLEKELK
jgi:hypothetical protein